MSAKPGAKRKRLKRALGVAGTSLLLAGASLSASAAVRAPQAASQLLHDEEVSDVTLATFYYFDKENDLPSRGAGRACGGGRGAAIRNRRCWGCIGGRTP
jgi:hypothetical protein